MDKRLVKDILGTILIVIGSMNVYNSLPGITGFSILSDIISKPIGGILGAALIIFGAILLLVEKK